MHFEIRNAESPSLYSNMGLVKAIPFSDGVHIRIFLSIRIASTLSQPAAHSTAHTISDIERLFAS